MKVHIQYSVSKVYIYFEKGLVKLYYIANSECNKHVNLKGLLCPRMTTLGLNLPSTQ